MTAERDGAPLGERREHSLMELERQLLRWKFDAEFNQEPAESFAERIALLFAESEIGDMGASSPIPDGYAEWKLLGIDRRKAPAQPCVVVPRENLEWLVRQRPMDDNARAYVLMEAVAMAERAVPEYVKQLRNSERNGE